MGIPGWGTVAGKIAEWFPSKAESLRNQEESLKRKLNEIQNRSPFTARDANEYELVADKLRQVQQKISNQ